MAREPSWTKDNFLSDFLCDTDQIAVDRSESMSTGYPDLDLLSADDVSLTSYLAGDGMDGSSQKTGSSSSSHASLAAWSNTLLGPDISSPTESHMPFIVVTKPAANQKIGKDNSKSKQGSSDSRQAIAARELRQKKKQYVSGLEASVESLTEENEQLKCQNARQEQWISKYKAEVKYLKNVIANESALSALLTNIQNSSGIKLTASLMSETDENAHPVVGLKRKLNYSIRDGSNVQGTASEDKRSASAKRLRSSKASASTSSTVSISQRQQLQNISCSESLNCLGDAVDNASPSNDEADCVIVETTKNCGNSAGKKTGKMMQSVVGSESDTNESDDGSDTDTCTGGICLHVMGDSVSVEFCASCNRSAAKSCSRDHAYFKSRD